MMGCWRERERERDQTFFRFRDKFCILCIIDFCILLYIHIYSNTSSSFFGEKHYFGPYILESQSIWSLHFSNGQFGPYYFQVAVNLVLTVNSLTENIYVASGLHC